MAEGEEKSKNDMENVRLLHIPYTTPIGPKDPEPQPRFKRKKYELKTRGQIFDKLLEVSTRLFNAVSDAGRNLSSMTTPVTIVGEENEIDVKKAAIDGFKIKKINGQILCESLGIVDTNVTDSELRAVLGCDALEDANVDLQGCTGSSDRRVCLASSLD